MDNGTNFQWGQGSLLVSNRMRRGTWKVPIDAQHRLFPGMLYTETDRTGIRKAAQHQGFCSAHYYILHSEKCVALHH